MKIKAPVYNLILLSAALVTAALGFITFPGCATPEEYNPQRGLYESAKRMVEKNKKRGELPGIESTAAGTFYGRWLWYDRDNSRGGEMLVVFIFSDGRPAKQIDLAYIDGWKIRSISTNR